MTYDQAHDWLSIVNFCRDFASAWALMNTQFSTKAPGTIPSLGRKQGNDNGGKLCILTNFLKNI